METLYLWSFSGVVVNWGCCKRSLSRNSGREDRNSASYRFQVLKVDQSTLMRQNKKGGGVEKGRKESKGVEWRMRDRKGGGGTQCFDPPNLLSPLATLRILRP